ncbi:MAG: Cupin 2 conserved barrel domain protein [Modestobacter sp.]|nr:Cupin 2 conserved barrel domain protein [Modestobacter sp.]
MPGYVVPPGVGRSFGPGINVKIEYEASSSFAAWESLLPPAWQGPPPHIHHAYDEAFYVVNGAVTFSLDGVEQVCPAGSVAFAARGTTHGFANLGVEPAKLLVIVTPGAIRLVEELFDLGRNGQPDPDAVTALFAQYDSEVATGVGPSDWGILR